MLMAVIMTIGVLGMTVSVSAEPGTDQDPLITLSYLNDTFMGQIMTKVEEKIAGRNNQIAQQISGEISGEGSGVAETFSVVTLTKGQVLTGGIGCEVMLRIGTASCVSPSNPGLIDETDGKTLGNGSALLQNHLYMMTIEGRGVMATANTTKLMVRGSYTIS